MDTIDSNTTDLTKGDLAIGQGRPNVADALFDRDIRLVVLLVIVIVGSMGGISVCVWLYSNWTKRSRVLYVICNVTLSDMLVLDVTCVMQLIWEWLDRRWMFGNVGCKLLKMFQGFSLMSSNFMVVILTFDRFQAVLYPLKPLCKTKKLTALGWTAGLILSCPQLFVFREYKVFNGGPFHNKTVCESIFRTSPIWSRQVYLTLVSCVVFYLPLVAIVLCYIAIYRETTKQSGRYRRTSLGYRAQFHLRMLSPCSSGGAKRGDGSRPKVQRDEPSKRHDVLIWSSRRDKSFALARMKTIKMAVVISISFVACVSPYHLLETWMNFGDHTAIPPSLAAVIGSLAVLHSAINPYIFLAFNAAGGRKRCFRRYNEEALEKGKSAGQKSQKSGQRKDADEDEEEDLTEDTLKEKIVLPPERKTFISTDLSIKITSTTQFCDI